MPLGRILYVARIVDIENVHFAARHKKCSRVR
jgi:hypothetical protein